MSFELSAKWTVFCIIWIIWVTYWLKMSIVWIQTFSPSPKLNQSLVPKGKTFRNSSTFSYNYLNNLKKTHFNKNLSSISNSSCKNESVRVWKVWVTKVMNESANSLQELISCTHFIVTSNIVHIKKFTPSRRFSW